MSNTPEAPAQGADVPASQKFKKCWSCRLISGGGLILCGAYVFYEARKVMRKVGPIPMGTVAQITFAACLAAWGTVVIIDPKGTAQKKT